MASVQIDAISVDYGKHRVLDKLSLEVKDGESLAVVGPSSCGKSTLMRALCGFIKISEGTIAIDGDIVSDGLARQYIQPEKRNIGVVFQDYAVWPHLTVLENIVYPLRKRRIPKAEALEKARRALAQVKMADFGSRLPAQLSGGQQQRVALARALVSSSRLIVLDEPITNLDAKLREEMAYEIRSLQSSVGVTILYITHDQETAMTIADRMVIMDRKGLIHQIGSPEEVWTKPEDKYVFEFLGVSNFVPVRFEQGKLTIKDGSTYQQLVFNQASGHGPGGGSGSGFGGGLENIDDVLLAIRPMDVIMHPTPMPDMLTGMVERVTYLGNQFDYIVSLGDRQLRVQQDSYDAFSKGVPREGSPCGLDLGNSVFYRSSDSRRLESAADKGRPQ
jgi:iron(III) transport system ATP-binding protein